MSNQFSGECPVCSAEITLGADTIEGELFSCEDCSSELEVATLSPFTLTEAPQEEEDWGE